MKKTAIKLALFCTLFTIRTSVWGQVPIQFQDCAVSQFFISAEKKPAWKSDSLSIDEYFNSYFSEKEELKKATGKVILEILVDKSGKVCCHSFTDINKTGFNPEDFKEAVTQMPDWNPAIQSGHEVNYMTNIFLEIKKGRVKQ